MKDKLRIPTIRHGIFLAFVGISFFGYALETEPFEYPWDEIAELVNLPMSKGALWDASSTFAFAWLIAGVFCFLASKLAGLNHEGVFVEK